MSDREAWVIASSEEYALNVFQFYFGVDSGNVPALEKLCFSTVEEACAGIREYRDLFNQRAALGMERNSADDYKLWHIKRSVEQVKENEA